MSIADVEIYASEYISKIYNMSTIGVYIYIYVCVCLPFKGYVGVHRHNGQTEYTSTMYVKEITMMQEVKLFRAGLRTWNYFPKRP